MAGKIIRDISIGIFLAAALGLGIVLVFPLLGTSPKNNEYPQSRIIIPQSLDFLLEESQAEQTARMEQMTLKAPMAEGEILVALLNEDFNGDLQDEQIIAYRNLLENEGPIHLAYIDRTGELGEYKRIWTAPTAATRPGTLSLYTQDLLGDRGICVLLAGMNSLGQQTLTIFKKDFSAEGESPPFTKIAEFSIDGSIKINVIERTQAYQMGMAKGQSYSITANGRDQESSNILDQVEITYAFNENTGQYEQTRIVSIPGAQVEQQRVREILGSQRAFEEFIAGLWYYVSPQGTIDIRQFIYFDPFSREIIYYADENQQVFIWQNSYLMRYGLNIRSQNISVSTMRRTMDIELESLDSVRVKIFEDVRLNFGIAAPWDGSYRKAGNPQNYASSPPPINAFIDAVYDSHLGKLHFYPDGNFELSSGGTVKRGKYAFFYLDDQELLELRNYESRTAEIQLIAGSRETYLVESSAIEFTSGTAVQLPRKTIVLSRIRLGAMGIQNLREGNITLNLVES